MGDLLAKAGRPFSLMGVDWFHRSWPPAEQDNAQVEARNIAAVWESYPSVGPRQLGRYSASQTSALEWHLERCDEIAARLEAADLDELVIDTRTLEPQEVAERALRRFGLLES